MSEERGGLKEKALSAYKTFLEGQERARKAAVQAFAEEAIIEFRTEFGKEPEKVTPESVNECILECDGMRFRARGRRAEISFYLKLKCEKCGRTYEQATDSLMTLGMELSEPQICQECKQGEKQGEE